MNNKLKRRTAQEVLKEVISEGQKTVPQGIANYIKSTISDSTLEGLKFEEIDNNLVIIKKNY